MVTKRRLLGYFGLIMFFPWSVWLLLGQLGWVPSLVDTFSVPGLRIPASFAIAGLLIAAVGFWQD